MAVSAYAGRLAPSPTGLLHLGHARTFWTAFERAQAARGKLWLRDEDLDPQRSRADFSTAMRDDLRWLGIAWNEEMRQSEHLPAYSHAMEQLIASGHMYVCTCSRRDLQQATQAPHEDNDDEPVYRGTCRPRQSFVQTDDVGESCHPHPERGEGEGPLYFSPPPQMDKPEDNASVPSTLAAYTSFNANYRFRVPDGETIAFTDNNAGPQSFRAGCDSHADFGDFLVWRKDGLPSYQLACVVDDAAMGITEVVRGRDLLKSTARQILLQRALSLPTLEYFHCDLMRDEAGVRLAKRHDALSLRALRESGKSPQAVRALF